MNVLLINTTWQRLLAVCSTLLLSLIIGSCGGNGAGANGAGSSVASLKAADLSLLTSEPSLGSDARESATITAIVKNDLNVSLAGESVIFSTADPGAILQVNETVTDSSGRATATLTITDRSVRTIVVSARSGQITRTVSIPVVGTVLSISGSSTIVFNAATQFSLSLRDSGGSPIPGAPVTVTSAANNSIAPTQIVTDALGQAVFNVTGLVAGVDTLTASAQGVSTTSNVIVSGTQITFQQPTLADLEVNTNWPVQVLLQENGSPLANRTVLFSSTRGTLSATSGVTNGAGIVAVDVTSSSAGISTLTATDQIGGTTGTKQIEFVSTTPTKMALQPSPSVVGANIDPSGTKSSQLIAVVRDGSDNPVKGVRVNFSSIDDPSNGRIEPGFGITDSSGTATASFIAGPNPTGADKVIIGANLPAYPAISSQSTLTVSELELSVVLGTGNLLQPNGPAAYLMPWVAIVSDSSGNPVSNAQVTVLVTPTRYRKGEWVPTGSRWGTITANIITCESEDRNGNGRLEASEDSATLTTADDPPLSGYGNGDGSLTPGLQGVATVGGAGVTDTDGLADINLAYTRSAGFWTEMELKVSITTTAGTEEAASEVFWLPVLADDLTIENSPPGANAPIGAYGNANSCRDPN